MLFTTPSISETTWIASPASTDPTDSNRSATVPWTTGAISTGMGGGLNPPALGPLWHPVPASARRAAAAASARRAAAAVGRVARAVIGFLPPCSRPAARRRK